jgi:hypothetical protein
MKSLGLIRIGSIKIALILCAAAMLVVSAGAQTAPTTIFGKGGINPLGVRQGTLGSCYFHSSIAAIARSNPDLIRNALSGNAQTGFKVQFGYGPSEIVFPEDVIFARTHNYDVSDGPWVAILLRGYAQLLLRDSISVAIDDAPPIFALVKPMAQSALDQSGPLLLAYDRAIRLVIHQDGHFDEASLKAALIEQFAALHIPPATVELLNSFLDSTGVFNAIAKTAFENAELFGAYHTVSRGGVPSTVFFAFEGKGHRNGADTDNADLLVQLENVHNGTLAMAAGTSPTGPKPSADVLAAASKPDWYVPGHAYTVLDWDAAQQLVTLRNPWGQNPDPDGVFTLPLTAFRKAYSRYFY